MNNFLSTFFGPPLWLIKKITLIIIRIIKFPFRVVADIFSFKQAKISSAVFLIIIVALFAGFLDYPKIWNQGADYFNSSSNLQSLNSKFQIPHFWNSNLNSVLICRAGR